LQHELAAPIDENATEAETNYRSSNAAVKHVAWGGAARAADQEDGIRRKSRDSPGPFYKQSVPEHLL
jgi:hypothetical protein